MQNGRNQRAARTVLSQSFGWSAGLMLGDDVIRAQSVYRAVIGKCSCLVVGQTPVPQVSVGTGAGRIGPNSRKLLSVSKLFWSDFSLKSDRAASSIATETFSQHFLTSQLKYVLLQTNLPFFRLPHWAKKFISR